MAKNLKRISVLALTALTASCLASAASAISVISVTSNDAHPDYLASYSVDGDDEKFWHTDWEAGTKEPPFIITYELDNVYEINSISLFPRQDNTLNGLIYWFNINVSDDGENFTTAQEVDWFEYSPDIQTVELETPVKTKYLQLEVFESEGYSFASLNQLYINGEAVKLSDDAKAAEDAAAEAEAAKAAAELQAAIEANGYKSITSDDQHSSYLAAYAGNGDESTFWHTDWEAGPQVPPYVITFELDNLYSVSEISLTPRPDAQADGSVNGAFIDFNIYSSVDGEAFTLAQTVTGLEPTLEVKTITLDTPVTTRYIRLEATLTCGETFASLNEMKYVGTVVDENSAVESAETENPEIAEETAAETTPETTVPETAETEAPETVAEAAPETAETPAEISETAPQTGDMLVSIAAAAAVISGAGIVLAKKRKS